MQQACHLIAHAHYMERPQQKVGDAYECIQTDSNKATSKTVNNCNMTVNAYTPYRKMKQRIRIREKMEISLNHFVTKQVLTRKSNNIIRTTYLTTGQN